MSFEKRSLTAIISLGRGVFGAQGFDTVKLDGMRIIANIDKAGGISQGTATISIFGMKQEAMNAVSMLAFHPLEVANNKITLFAGDVLVFEGTIIAARPDYQSMPEVYVSIEAMTGYLAALKPVAARSYKGATDVATIISSLAADMGYAFENNGVQVTLSNPCLPGTALQQLKQIVNDADIDCYVDDTVLAITRKGSARAGEIPVVSALTGLVGYPTYDKMGITFNTEFNPAIRFGGSVLIESDVTICNGEWRVVSIAHTLESERPGGAWFTRAWVTDNAVTIVR